MLHPETLESYRRMTPGERLQLTFELLRENEPYLYRGTPEEVARRLELLRRQNDDRNARILAAIERSRGAT